MPPVIAPSPITATTLRRWPNEDSSAVARPWAHDSTVDAWLFSIQSCSLSARVG